jgi:hypothetical protein
VAKDVFSFHVMVRINGDNQKQPFEFSTPQGKEISKRLKDHVNVLLEERRKDQRRRPELVPHSQHSIMTSQLNLSSHIMENFFAEPSPDEAGTGRTPFVAPPSAAPDAPATGVHHPVPAVPEVTRAAAILTEHSADHTPALPPPPPPPSVDTTSAAAAAAAATSAATTVLTPAPDLHAVALPPPPPPSASAPVEEVARAMPQYVAPGHMAELALVFPDESPAELVRVLAATKGNVESAAAMLLEQPPPPRARKQFTPPAILRREGGAMQEAMSVMSAAMDPVATSRAAPALPVPRNVPHSAFGPGMLPARERNAPARIEQVAPVRPVPTEPSGAPPPRRRMNRAASTAA